MNESGLYGKYIFLSKEQEKEWEEAPESIKTMRDCIVRENLEETRRKLEETCGSQQYWKNKCQMYEWLYLESVKICDDYKELVLKLGKDLKKRSPISEASNNANKQDKR